MKEIIAYEMQYNQIQIEKANISCVPFQKSNFEEYMGIYNACFYDMRKELEIEPYNFLSEYTQIMDRVEDIFLLVENEKIIGSVACYGNEIDDLVVNKDYQNCGYGKQLLLWGMNHIRQQNNAPITLHVAEWNSHAISLYEKVGFQILKREKVR